MNAALPELQRRLLYALLQPAIQFCRQFHVPLDVLEQLSRLAYYEALRAGGARQAEVADVFGKSLRTVVSVEKQLHTDFLAPAAEVDATRRMEEALGEGPVTAADLAQRLGLEPVMVERLMKGLVEAGRARPVEQGGFVHSERFLSLVKDDLLARLQGLHHQLETVLATVQRRFFGGDDPRPSAARTLSFVGTADEVQAFADELIRFLRARAVEVEERSLERGGFERYAVTVALAPAVRRDPAAPPGAQGVT